MLLINCNVVDVVAGKVVHDAEIKIKGNSIERIGKSGEEKGEDSLDLNGSYVLPGLINAHTHLSIYFPYNEADPNESPFITAMRSYKRAIDALNAGVTTVRCTGEWYQADLKLRSMIERGFVSGEGWSQVAGMRWLLGPRIFGAGRGISTTGGHGAGFGAVEADGPDQFMRAARRELEAGADHLKIFITGGIAKKSENYIEPQTTDEEMSAAVSVAKSKGTYVCAHVGGSRVIERAIKAGVTCFEHCYQLDNSAASAIRDINGFVVPTLCVSRSPVWMRDHRYEEWTIKKALDIGEDHLESIRTAVRSGVNIAMGTDIPPGDENDGVNASVREIEFLTESGMSNLGALRAATINAAKLCITNRKIGAIKEGYLADLISVPTNPLEDLHALRHILLVMKDGQIIRNQIARRY
jgi:imidazolonepropionase-like amidohydrolase